jgi:16S rRNA (cytosine1402-N4)-methyltransferase
MNDGPLDMRMDQNAKLTASEVVNEYSAEDLANVLYKYGEFTNSRSLARQIIACRPFNTTNELASVIPDQRNRNKILARIFQAIRIEVNDELGQLERSLDVWLEMLNPGGRLAIISFHSLEDRIIKDYFARYKADDMLSDFIALNKKPIVAGPDEIVHNPRSRSAKLRGLQRK